MIYPAGATVRLVLHDRTTIEGVIVVAFLESSEMWRFDSFRIKARKVKQAVILKQPKATDKYVNGTILYAMNNAYHHVWVKSGSQWYTANRVGSVSWEAILAKCDNWKMPLWQVPTPNGPLSSTILPAKVYTP